MKPHNFDALARLANMRIGSGAYNAARLHLIDGLKQNEAADLCNIKPATVSQAVARIHRAELLALRATR